MTAVSTAVAEPARRQRAAPPVPRLVDARFTGDGLRGMDSRALRAALYPSRVLVALDLLVRIVDELNVIDPFDAKAPKRKAPAVSLKVRRVHQPESAFREVLKIHGLDSSSPRVTAITPSRLRDSNLSRSTGGTT